MSKETSGDLKRDNFIKQQQQLKAMNPTGGSKNLSADSMIEYLLSKKETFQKRTETSVAKAQNGPPWLNPENAAAVHPMYTKIWEMVKLPAAAGKTHDLADTALVSSLLMTSGLTTDMLGFIWSLANNTIPGALTQIEFYSVLALVALAQSGYIFNNITVLNQLPQPIMPNLNLSILIQMKSNFTAAINTRYEAPVAQSPVGVSAGNGISGVGAVGQSIGTNYFSQYPTNVEAKGSPTSNIVSLDVNNLQGAPSLTLPSSFGYNAAQSTAISASMQQNFPAPAGQVAGVIPVQNFQNIAPNASPVQPGIGSVIPSISLGISLPQPMAVLNQSSTPAVAQQNLSSVSTPVTPMTDNIQVQALPRSSDVNYISDHVFTASGAPQTGVDHFDVVFSSSNVRTSIGNNFDEIKSKFSALSLNDSKISTPNAEQTGNVMASGLTSSDSFNIDESFDSLSTERALSNTNKLSNSMKLQNNAGTNNGENKILKPNYDVNLFNSYSDVKPIFPANDNFVSANQSEMPEREGDLKDDPLVMHNPIYCKEEDGKNSKFENITFAPNISANFALGMKVQNPGDINNVEDDFTDFQSADFTSFNNFTAPPVDKTDLSDNFSDFQQASTVSLDSNSKPCYSTAGINTRTTNDEASFNDSGTKVVISSNGNDDDLFPSLNLKFDNLNSSTKSAEVSDCLSIKSIDISIISSGNNTEGNSSPVSSDYNGQENVKDDSKSSSQDDKVFLSLSSSLVFENSNSSGDNAKCTQKSSSQPSSSAFNNIQPQQVGDKYSALRMLEMPPNGFDSSGNKDNVNDDFGDFVAAEPEQLQLPDITAVPSDASTDSRSAEVKCLEACLSILEKSYEVLKAAATPGVLGEILSDPRGSEHLSCLLEVYKVSERLMQHSDCKSNPLASQVQAIWDLLLVMVPDIVASYRKQVEENTGPKCGVCKCNYGPTPVRYGLNYYHPPCANLYLRYVSPLLPSIPI